VVRLSSDDFNKLVVSAIFFSIGIVFLGLAAYCNSIFVERIEWIDNIGVSHKEWPYRPFVPFFGFLGLLWCAIAAVNYVKDYFKAKS
jgi:hypothetical protein